jgi:hypothetical protein
MPTTRSHSQIAAELYDLQVPDWPGEIAFDPASEVEDPATGHRVRRARAWSYAPSTQTAVLLMRWEEIGPDGELVDRWQTGPIRLHCAFRFEVAHLLARTGFEVEALYGDFSWSELRDDSSEMIWVATR